MTPSDDHLEFVPGFTVLTAPDSVTLIAGEDQRYALEAPGLETWLPGLLQELDGRHSLAEVLAALPDEHRADATELVESLRGERLLRPSSSAILHRPQGHRLQPEGTGPLPALLPADTSDADAPFLRVLCQDRLDYAALDAFLATCRTEGVAAMWVTTGPSTRGLVSPVQRPEGGACLQCLIAGFRRRSPAPELYDQLRAHAKAGGEVAAAAFPEVALEIIAGLVRAKAASLAEDGAPAYRLHSLEVSTLEVTSHPVPMDPDCARCTG